MLLASPKTRRSLKDKAMTLYDKKTVARRSKATGTNNQAILIDQLKGKIHNLEHRLEKYENSDEFVPSTEEVMKDLRPAEFANVLNDWLRAAGQTEMSEFCDELSRNINTADKARLLSAIG